MDTTTELVIIDPQNDFVDPNGSLSVPGADGDMDRIADFIDKFGRQLADINITLDSHHDVDIAHPICWVDSKRSHPDPFTIISLADFDSGAWRFALPQYSDYVRGYLETLETSGRYPLCIWPPHCIIGTPGHGIWPKLSDSIRKWERDNIAIATKVTKGSNWLTEHYSAVQAEVPDPDDASTQPNISFVNKLKKAVDDGGKLLIAGEALSHCVANTVRDVANLFGDDKYVSGIVLLEDACSSVPGFENLADDFIKDMTEKGMEVSTTDAFFAVSV